MSMKKSLLIGSMVAGLLTTSVFAADTITNSTKTTNAKPKFERRCGGHMDIKGTLDKLVKAGTINQSQSDAILKEIPKNGPMQKLVSDGTLTQEAVDKVCAAMQAGKDSGKTREAVLKDLVGAGTITQAQADTIIKDAPPMHGDRKPMNMMKLTDAQMTAVKTAMDAAKGDSQKLKDSLAALVKDGKLTQEQADFFSKPMPMKMHGHERQPLKTNLQ